MLTQNQDLSVASWNFRMQFVTQNTVQSEPGGQTEALLERPRLRELERPVRKKPTCRMECVCEPHNQFHTGCSLPCVHTPNDLQHSVTQRPLTCGDAIHNATFSVTCFAQWTRCGKKIQVQNRTSTPSSAYTPLPLRKGP